jgi:hypothetical protein
MVAIVQKHQAFEMRHWKTTGKQLGNSVASSEAAAVKIRSDGTVPRALAGEDVPRRRQQLLREVPV